MSFNYKDIEKHLPKENHNDVEQFIISIDGSDITEMYYDQDKNLFCIKVKPEHLTMNLKTEQNENN